MTINEYQALAMRTNDSKCNDRVLKKTVDFSRKIEENAFDPGELLNGALGLSGESGEVADLIKKHIFHGHNLDKSELIKELGDVSWYLALLCTAIDVSLETIMELNITKLKTRYPEGFSELASINRTE